MAVINNYLDFKSKVNIAGTFNGVLHLNEKVNEISVDQNGKPSKMNEDYKNLLSLKDIYKNKGIDVLNIYGDVQDGTHSDERVSNSSSKSLKYLLEIALNLIKKLNILARKPNIVNYMKTKMLLTKSYSSCGTDNPTIEAHLCFPPQILKHKCAYFKTSSQIQFMS